MAWTFVRPADPGVLSGRPLLDIGTGDGQTLTALVAGTGLVVGLDRSLSALRAARMTGLKRSVCSAVPDIPFRSGVFEVVLAGDLWHHLADDALRSTLGEVRRVLTPGGRVVAWWYEAPARPAPDAPAFPRSFAEVARITQEQGFASVRALDLEIELASGPPTVGLVASNDPG